MSTQKITDLNDLLKYNFVLWIKFKSGECRTLKAYSMVTTVNQYLYGKGPIRVDYEKGMNGLLKLVNVTYRGQFQIALIFKNPKVDNTQIAKCVNGHWVESVAIDYAKKYEWPTRLDFDKYNGLV